MRIVRILRFLTFLNANFSLFIASDNIRQTFKERFIR